MTSIHYHIYECPPPERPFPSYPATFSADSIPTDPARNTADRYVGLFEGLKKEIASIQQSNNQVKERIDDSNANMPMFEEGRGELDIRLAKVNGAIESFNGTLKEINGHIGGMEAFVGRLSKASDHVRQEIKKVDAQAQDVQVMVLNLKDQELSKVTTIPLDDEQETS